MKNKLMHMIVVVALGTQMGTAIAGGPSDDGGAFSNQVTAYGGTGGSATGGGASVAVNISAPAVSTADGLPGAAGSNAFNTKSTVDYGGSYTVRSTPSIAAPALTATLSDTCMGSASFGLSLVGLGATAGTTMVDEACVRRLDSREFRAMGLNDVALALLCQSGANRRAVEATGRSCPSAMPVAAAATLAQPAPAEYSDPLIRYRLGLQPTTPVAAEPVRNMAVSAVKLNAVQNHTSSAAGN